MRSSQACLLHDTRGAEDEIKQRTFHPVRRDLLEEAGKLPIKLKRPLQESPYETNISMPLIALSTARIMETAVASDGNSGRVNGDTLNLLLLKNCNGIEDLYGLGIGILWPKRDDEGKGFVVEDAIVLSPQSILYPAISTVVSLSEGLKALTQSRPCLEGFVTPKE